MQISKACHLCLTNNENNRKIILLAFLCTFHVHVVKRIKEKLTFQKCLQNVFEMKIIYKAKMSTEIKSYIYTKNTVHLLYIYTQNKVHLSAHSLHFGGFKN